jgi:hypothetical protein
MGEKVRSHGQTGGITAHTVNIQTPPPPNPPPRRKPWWRTTSAIVFWLVSVAAGIAVTADYIEKHHSKEEHMSDKKDSTYVISHNQSGGITAHTVNMAPPERHMNSQLEGQLNQLVPKSSKVHVAAGYGDAEAFAFAQEITAWLKANGWPQVEGTSQAVWNRPIFNQEIDTSKPGEIELRIGTRR